MNAEQMNKFLALGVQHGASDIHLKVGGPPAYRVSGVLHSIKADNLGPDDTRSMCLHLIRDTKVKERIDEIQEFDTSYSIRGVGRFRANIFRQRGTLCAVLRIIPGQIPSLEELGLPPVIQQFAQESRGMVLVTGATGSGKSTTLASIIDLINKTRKVHVLTIEDPIEYLHRNQMASVTQREIGLDTANFSVALRAAVRQDPDVILVGEMRDPETIDIALKAAETGHLVFSTVHTTDAAKTINRLISFFPPDSEATVRHRIAEALKGTIIQRLLPKADGKGRVLACEIMLNTQTTQGCIKDASKTSSLKDFIEKGAEQYNMQSFDQHLQRLLKKKLISLETAIAASSNPADFQRNLYLEE